MPDARRLFGNRAERRAARFLRKKGLQIIARQYQTQFGEIDLIALDGDEVVFVEVKARRSAKFGHPEAAVTRQKVQKIVAVGMQFLQEKQWVERAYRLDVVAIDHEGIRHIPHVGAR